MGARRYLLDVMRDLPLEVIRPRDSFPNVDAPPKRPGMAANSNRRLNRAIPQIRILITLSHQARSPVPPSIDQCPRSRGQRISRCFFGRASVSRPGARDTRVFVARTRAACSCSSLGESSYPDEVLHGSVLLADIAAAAPSRDENYGAPHLSFNFGFHHSARFSATSLANVRGWGSSATPLSFPATSGNSSRVSRARFI